jgi:hypothetical protein
VASRSWRGLAVALLAACGGTPIALPTLEPPTAGFVEVCPEELLGPVILQERLNTPAVPVVAVRDTGETIPLVWSREFSATFSPLVVRASDGEVLARDGDTVWLTGGSGEGDGYYVCGVSTSPP